MNERGFWREVINNISSIITVLAAVIALIMNQIKVIPIELLMQIVIALLALIATSFLIDHRRSIGNLTARVDHFAKLFEGQSSIKVQHFKTIDDALSYLAERTRSVRFCVDQASIDKQRAKKADNRLRYEKIREELILADRITYRYIGMIDDQRRFSSVRKIMQTKQLHKFFPAFAAKPSNGLPLLSFIIFDKEEVFTRVPYDIGEEPTYITIYGTEIANLFIGYFEKIWEFCRKVESVEQIDEIMQAILSESEIKKIDSKQEESIV